MTLQQLNDVIAIAETGSFNRAAERLYISQPSLTSAIKELEKELDVILFKLRRNPDGGGRELPALCTLCDHAIPESSGRIWQNRLQKRAICGFHTALFLCSESVLSSDPRI